MQKNHHDLPRFWAMVEEVEKRQQEKQERQVLTKGVGGDGESAKKQVQTKGV